MGSKIFGGQVIRGLTFGLVWLGLCKPAFSQFASSEYTFSGQVGTSCEFVDLNPLYLLPYEARGALYSNLSGEFRFSVSANSQVALNVLYEPIQVPVGYVNNNSAFAAVGESLNQGNSAVVMDEGVVSSNALMTLTPGTQEALIAVRFAPVNLPGDYSYRLRLTCLVP